MSELLEAITTVETLLSQLSTAYQKTTELLVDTSKFSHDVVHALAHGQRVEREIAIRLGNAANFRDERLDVGGVGIKLSSRYQNWAAGEYGWK